MADGKIVIETEVDLAGFKSGLRTLQNNAKTAGNSIDGLGGALDAGAGKGAAFEKALGGIVGTAGLVGAGITAAKKALELYVQLMVESVKASIEFESAITGVYKTVDATQSELAEITAGIKDLAMEIPATTTEIASVAEAAGQLGIAKEDILSFTETMINLGEATNLSADAAASSLAKFANITKMSADNYERLGSTIVALGNNFATTESDIVNMATRLASTATVAGFTETEMLALSAALSSVGMEAEAGGTAISKLIKEMQDAAKSGNTARKTLRETGYSLRDLELLADADSKAFKELAQSMGFTSGEFRDMLSQAQKLEKFAEVAGMTADGFSKMWEEAPIEAMNAFITGLGEIDKAGGDALAVLNELGFTEARLSNAVLSLAAADNVLAKAQNEANKAWEENVALSEEAEKRYETLESKINLLKNAWERVKVAIGDTLGDELGVVAREGADTLEFLATIIEENGEKLNAALNTFLLLSPATSVFGTAGWLYDLLDGNIPILSTPENKVSEETKNREPTKREHEIKTTAAAYEKYIEKFQGKISKTTLDKVNEALYEAKKTTEQILAELGMDADEYAEILGEFTVETTNAFGRTDTGADSVIGIGQMIANLEANQKTMKQWGENLDALAERMMDFEGGEYVVQQFRDMGVGGAAQLAKLLTATDAELEKLAQKMQTGVDLSVEVRANFLGVNAESDLEQAMKPIKEKLAEYKELFEHGMLTQEQFDNLTKPLLDQLGANIGEQIEERKTELKEQLEAYNKAFSEGMLTQEQFDQLTKPIYKELDNLTNNMDIIEKSMRSEVESALIEAQKEAEKADRVGRAMAENVVAGIEANKDKIKDVIVQSVEDGIEAAKAAAEIAGVSPFGNKTSSTTTDRRSGQQHIIDNAKEHAYTPTARDYSYIYGGNSNTSNANTYNSSNIINFNQPIQTPAQVVRAIINRQKQDAQSFS